MQIHNASSALTSEAMLCFTKAPVRVVLRPGENLFRFATIVSPTFKGNEVFASPWWITQDTYRQITKAAHRLGKPVVDVARSRLAIATAWNPKMDWLTILELKKPVYAWVGPVKPQPFSASQRTVTLLGNYDQAYVPDLAPPQAMTSEAARLMYFGTPPD